MAIFTPISRSSRITVCGRQHVPHDQAFRNFEFQAAALESWPMGQRICHGTHEIGLRELQRRHVYRERNSLLIRLSPSRDLIACILQYPGADRQDHSCLFSDRDEFRWRNTAQFGASHTSSASRLANRPCQVDLGLVIHLNSCRSSARRRQVSSSSRSRPPRCLPA